MPSFIEATVTELLEARLGLQRVLVQRHPEVEPEKAFVLTQTIGSVELGDRVIVNTTAVDLELGTGGWHIIHWNLTRGPRSDKGPGHIMKLRYTSLQADTGVLEENSGFVPDNDLATKPVVVCLLHSQVAAVAAAIAATAPGTRVAYVMTDQAALPLAMSDLVFDLVNLGLLHATITAGQAFGGQLEAVNVASALSIANTAVQADIVIVGPGPGVVGTGTVLGFGQLEAAHGLEDAARLGGFPILALRYSDADERSRHQGLSHHSATVLQHTFAKAQLAVPEGIQIDPIEGHAMVSVPVPDMPALFASLDLEVSSMGRSASADPNFFAFAGAAGVLAAVVHQRRLG